MIEHRGKRYDFRENESGPLEYIDRKLRKIADGALYYLSESVSSRDGGSENELELTEISPNHDITVLSIENNYLHRIDSDSIEHTHDKLNDKDVVMIDDDARDTGNNDRGDGFETYYMSTKKGRYAIDVEDGIYTAYKIKGLPLLGHSFLRKESINNV